MRVLVCAASRHGSTVAIAERVGAVLREHAVDVHVRVPAEVAGLDAYDAVVLGSAVYMGRWLARARRFVVGHRAALAAMPVWLFSSGPIGDPPQPPGEPAEIEQLARSIGAREHRVFAGRLDRRGLGVMEKVVVAAVHAPDGDFRDWAAVEAWAAGIARTLLAAPGRTGPSGRR